MAEHLFEQLNALSRAAPTACGRALGDVEHQSSTARLMAIGCSTWCGCPVEVLFKPAFGRRTDSRRPGISEPYFPRSRRGRYRPTDRSERRRIRALPAFFAKLRTADHRRFRPSKDRCFGSPPRAPACRSQCRRIAIVRPGAGCDKSPKRPPACPRKGSSHRC
jgi:hypothetical protein